MLCAVGSSLFQITCGWSYLLPDWTCRVPGLIGLAALELELEGILGREVELRTTSDLSPHFRDEVSLNARTLYAAA